jgi:hypothetical protein
MVWRNTEALTIDPFVVGVLGAFGISKPTLAKIFADPRDLIHGEARAKSLLIHDNPNNKGYMDWERDLFTARLLAPEALRRLLDKYLAHLRGSLAWEAMSPVYVLSSKPAPGETRTVSLARFCQYTVSFCTNNTFFGSKLQQVAPDFLHHYQAFEKLSWKIFYRIPPFLARSSHRAKERAIDGLVEYLDLAEGERSELEPIFRIIASELGFLGVGTRDIAAFVMVIIWA